jgi:DNA-directed RNA polymerase subunit RPC12/RpoP
MMEKITKERLKCPNCGSHMLKKTLTKFGARAVLSRELQIPYEEKVMHRCYTCGYEFEEDD